MSGGFPGFGTLSAQKRIKFEDVHPGSVIEVHDRRNPNATSFEATVLETRREYGPTGVPALVLRRTGDEDVSIITSNGNWEVTVLADSSALAGEEPDDVVALIPKPLRRHALRFTGGIQNAEQIVRWAAGKAVISWHAGEAGNSEHLTVHTLEGPQRVDVGTWVARGLKGEFYPMAAEVLEAGYDIVEKDEDA